MSWCGCEDYPCCGHDAGMGPESAEDFLSELNSEEYEFALRTMRPCPECGEMRPRNDPVLRREGMCHMCHQDEKRRHSPVAGANLEYFTETLNHDHDRIRELEAEVAKLRSRLDK